VTPLAQFDPLVRDWFTGKFATVTEPQRLGWPEIQAGRDVLISAPTGSGKTLAAFLTAIDSLGAPGTRRRASQSDRNSSTYRRSRP
jgi:ATP-dependent Lhr-like helicase